MPTTTKLTPAETVSADVLDLEAERLARRCSEMDDETLVFVMLGLLQPYAGGSAIAGYTDGTATMARTAFMEVGMRWIPLEVFAPAFKQLLEDDDA